MSLRGLFYFVFVVRLSCDKCGYKSINASFLVSTAIAEARFYAFLTDTPSLEIITV